MSSPKSTSGGRLWIRLIRQTHAVRDLTVPCLQDRPLIALREAMHELDLAMPVWLPRHQSDWKTFGLTHFTQEHFVEPIDFDRMEISYIAPEEKRKPPCFSESD